MHTLFLPVTDPARATHLMRRILRYKTHQIKSFYILKLHSCRKKVIGMKPAAARYLAVITYW